MYQLSFLPWHENSAQHWLSQPKRSQSWLIHASRGTGKIHLAHVLAATMLCERPSVISAGVRACGLCQACHWFQHDVHPDFRRVHPQGMHYAIPEWMNIDSSVEASADEEKSGHAPESTGAPSASEEIKIDQIRSLGEFFQLSRHRDSPRIVLIYPAERLNTGAANALLKILEEPPLNSLIFLITDQIDAVLPTLRSRCVRLSLPDVPKPIALEWLDAQMAKLVISSQNSAQKLLDACGGAPIAALQCAVETDKLEALLPLWSALKQYSQLPNTQTQATLLQAMQQAAPQVWLRQLQCWTIDLSLAIAGRNARYHNEISPNAASSAKFKAVSQDGVLSSIIANPERKNKFQENLWFFYRWLSQQMRVARHPLNPKLFAQVGVQHFHQIWQCD